MKKTNNFRHTNVTLLVDWSKYKAAPWKHRREHSHGSLSDELLNLVQQSEKRRRAEPSRDELASSCSEFCGWSAWCKRVCRQSDPAAPQWEWRALGWTGLAYKIRIKKHDYDRDVIMEMPTDTTVNLLEIRVSHLTLFCRFLQCCFHKPPSTSLQDFLAYL